MNTETWDVSKLGTTTFGNVEVVLESAGPMGCEPQEFCVLMAVHNGPAHKNLGMGLFVWGRTYTAYAEALRVFNAFGPKPRRTSLNVNTQPFFRAFGAY